MKKTKIFAIIVALILILNIIIPAIPVIANSSYELTFSVANGTKHTITVEDNYLKIDDGVVELRDSNDNSIGTVTSTGENSAKITVTDGPDGELNYGGNNFSLFYNGNPYNFGEKLNTNQDFLVQDSNTGGEVDPNNRNFQVDFNEASYTIGNEVVTASVQGATNYRNVSLTEKTEISLTNFNPETMMVVVRGQDGWATNLTVNNGKTSLLKRGSDNEGNLCGIPGGMLFFSVEAKQENINSQDNHEEQGNTVANITVSAGEGTWIETVYDKETGKSRQEERAYDDIADFLINGSRWIHDSKTISYNSNEEDQTVDFEFDALWIDRYYEDIVINGVSYNVSDYLNFDDRTAWLNANHGSQTVSFTIPNVAKADSYNIVVKHGMNSGKKFLATFLWTADPSQEYEIERDEEGNPVLDRNGKYKYILDEKGNKIPGKDYIGHARLEFVKAEYQVGNENYTVTEKGLEGKLHRDGEFKTCGSDDGFLRYGVLADADFDDGNLTLPGNAQVTMRVVPEYGYQVTSVNGGNDFATTEEGVSEFTVFVPEGTAGYFTATVEKVENSVNPTSEKIKAGEIQLGKSAAGDIKNGTVRLTVEDIELSSDKIANFQNKANEAGDYTISNYLDINLDKVLYRGTEDSVWSEQIHHLTDKALITLQLEEGIDASNIVIVHNIDNGDEFEIIEIESYDAETNTISFYTDSFSNYAIASKNAKTEEKESKETKDAKETKSNMPKTGDNILVVISILVISILGIAGTIKFNKK